jgi:hypothetical protein
LRPLAVSAGFSEDFSAVLETVIASCSQSR